jgi:hypothetical protein
VETDGAPDLTVSEDGEDQDHMDAEGIGAIDPTVAPDLTAARRDLAPEREDSLSLALRLLEAKTLSTSLRTPRLSSRLILTSLAPSLSTNANSSRRELLQARVVPIRTVAPLRSVAEIGTESTLHEKCADVLMNSTR